MRISDKPGRSASLSRYAITLHNSTALAYQPISPIRRGTSASGSKRGTLVRPASPARNARFAATSPAR